MLPHFLAQNLADCARMMPFDRVASTFFPLRTDLPNRIFWSVGVHEENLRRTVPPNLHSQPRLNRRELEVRLPGL